MNIDFIYFDVGGVAILDFSKTNKWNKMLNDIGVNPADVEKLNTLFDEEEPKYCVGEKEADSFIPILKHNFKLKLPADYSFLEDFVNRFERNPTLADIIKDLKGKYRLGLLTNMYPKMLDMIIGKGLLPKVEWDTIIDSSEVGFRKPHPEIYKLASGMAETSADKILFVENSKMHIDGAQKLGWNTFLYDPSDVAESNRKLLDLLN